VRLQGANRSSTVVFGMYVMARGAQDFCKRIGRVDVVINNQDAKARARHRLVVANRRGTSARVPERRQADDDSLPWFSPLLRASTLPPCSSTSRCTNVRPMPRPPVERSIERSTCVNRSNKHGGDSSQGRAGDPKCRLGPPACGRQSAAHWTTWCSRKGLVDVGEQGADPPPVEFFRPDPSAATHRDGMLSMEA